MSEGSGVRTPTRVPVDSAWAAVGAEVKEEGATLWLDPRLDKLVAGDDAGEDSVELELALRRTDWSPDGSLSVASYAAMLRGEVLTTADLEDFREDWWAARVEAGAAALAPLAEYVGYLGGEVTAEDAGAGVLRVT